MSDDDGSHPRVLISNRQPLPVDQPSLAALAREVLRAEGVERAELSVSFVEDAEMADLHRRYLGEPGPTDVLAFPIGEDDGEGVRVLGDVVIAPAYAAQRNPDLPAELRLLLVHGILHLLGYDHEEEGERREMFARQERYSGVRVA
ncbi:MAG TPA: rRNA maturation RNase YbeY [Actinomycetota bacterium]|nr:rRNA maturation RNase YbeY [Actinomycetota bacterium]